ncbi:hypothetical protein CB0940_07992 [Cercospora beticola]|uniref:Uncharacterized protein n=1 Tax=Cercospora beticola TaxID=122368 RepID=A0A2G5HPB7_CERBT|nr:hypothetical protein CB0940_07992 [Cercospora beticola]PIA94103.1 hypothetical protein CB0940_07992 [Cercospora beticola]WPB04546.1 hypothetical protein RHO25_009192 [Cercospora beticola]
MPGKVLSPYKQVPETKADLDWAELVTLDLSLFDQPNGKQQLADQLAYAAQHVGFFYVKNFDISQEEVDRQFALGREFYNLPLEEKLQYHNLKDLESGEYNGYRPAGLRQLTETIRDNVEVYNIPKFDGFHHRAQPPVLQDHIKEIEMFSRKCHDLVITKLLKLFAILLELPSEDQLVDLHKYDTKGEDHLRYMHYKARTPEENKLVGELYSPGHTDLGSLTLLFRQPVAALQILNSKNEWKWVRPQDATITVNICDALSALTGNWLKSSVHRVHAPPEDQAHVDRLGVLYFSRPNNHVLLDPISNSPVLEKLGIKDNEFTKLGQHLTMEEWCKLRQTQQQRRTKAPKIEGTKYTYENGELEVMKGYSAKVYN